MTESIVVALIGAVGVLLGGGIVTLITFFVQRHDNKNDALMGLLHERIIDKADMYQKRGYISLCELNDFEKYLFNPYKKLGGNGSAETAYNILKTLPHAACE